MHTDKLFFFVLVLPICFGGVGTQTVQAQGNCEDYDSNKKFRFGDQCKNAAGDAAVNYSDAAGLDGDYVAIGIDGGTGYVDYEWEPPSNLEKINVTIRASIKDDSAGELKIKYWNGSDYVYPSIRKNENYSDGDYIKIEFLVSNEELIGNGYFAMQFITNDGWWIDQVEADWTEAEPKPKPAISVSPGEATYTLGGVTVGESTTKEFTVENTGDATLDAEPSLSGDTGQFSITNGASLSLGPGESYTFDVEFAPEEAGTHQVDFEINHNGANIGSPWRATLAGEGEPEPKPAISVSPGEATYTLGEVTVGQSTTKEFTVENTGDATLNAEPSLSGDTGQFSITNGASLSLGPGESYTFDVEFAPEEASTHQVDFKIDHNGANTESPWRATLGGKGVLNADLTVQVRNVTRDGNVINPKVPKENGVVKLYTGGTSDTDPEDSNPTKVVENGEGKGKAIFEGLDPSNTFLVRAFHEPGDKSVFGAREYWGRRQDVELSNGESKTLTLTRYHPYVTEVDVLKDGNSVKGSPVLPNTELTLEVTLRNAGSSDLPARPRLVLDQKDKSAPYIFDRREEFSFKTVPGGGTQTFQTTWIPSSDSDGEVYSTYEAYTKTDLGTEVTDGGTWASDPIITVEPNEKPVVSVPEDGLKKQPSSMYPGRTYTVTTTYKDQNGVSNLDHVDLLLDHPTDETIHLRKTIGGGSGVESGQKFLAPFSGPSIEKSEKKVVVDWTFTFKNEKSIDWAAVENREQGISFQVEATDDAGQTATDESDVKASYRSYGTTVITHGFQSPGGLQSSAYDDELSRWLRDAACRIREKAGRGRVLVQDPDEGGFYPFSHFDTSTDSFYRTLEPCDEPNTDSGGEDILIFTWDRASNDLGLGFSESAASTLFASLKARGKKIDGLGPLHLLGHSRGTAVMSEVAERLLSTGKAVNHVTYLDPHDWGVDPATYEFDGSLGILLDLLPSRSGDLVLHDYDVNRPIGVSYPEGTPYTELNYKAEKPVNVVSNGAVGWKGVGWIDTYWQRNGEDDASVSKSSQSVYRRDNCFSSNLALNGRPVRGTFSREWSDVREVCPDGTKDKLNHGGIYREYIRSISKGHTAEGGYEYSRIGGFPHTRPERGTNADGSVNGDPVQRKFKFSRLGRGILNGDFQRGTKGIPDYVFDSAQEDSQDKFLQSIPGWTYHGGGGQAQQDNGKLVLDKKGNTRVSNWFYIPESADKIFFTYEIADEGEDENDVLEASLDGGEGFEDEFGTAVTSGDRGSAGSISLDGKTGSVQRLRFQIGNPGTDGFNPDATVYVDNVQFITGENPPPFVANEPDDREVRRENGPVTVNLQNVFDDPDGESLQYGAPSSSNSSVATASEDGGTVTVSLESGGETTISLSAEDGAGQVAETSFTVRVIDTPLPDPAITEQADPPVAVQPGETFTMSVTATNEGGPATYGSISASFPAYDQPSDAERVKSDSPTSGDGESYVERSEGQTIFNSEDEEVEAKYLLTEYADDKWESGETNTLDLQVTAPSKEGQFTVYLRTTLSSGKEDVTVPGESSDAQTATDQQGYRVFEIPVQVTNDSGTPVVENPIADQTLLVTQESEFTKELDAVFSDPNGEDLSYEATMTSENSGREVVSVEIASGVLVVTPLSAGTATVEVTATDAAENSVTEDFTVTAENPAPTLTKLIPSRGEKGETLDLTVEGSGFVKEESTLEFSGSGISVNQRTVSSSSEIKATLSIASDASEGNREVVISNPTPGGGSSEPETFTVLEEAVAGPAVPTDLQASAGDSQVELSWSAGEGSSPVGYDLYRSTSPFGDTTEAGRVNPSLITGGAEYTDKSVSNGTEYVYRVVAVGEDGERSGASSAASATPTSGNEPPQVVINEGLSVEEGKTKTITTDELSASDQNDGAEALTFEVTGRPSRGDLFVDGAVAGSAGAPSFTQADLEGGDVEYRHTAENASDDRFTFEVTDGQVGTSEREFTIEIEPTSPLAPVPEEVSASSLPDRAVEISWKAGGEGGADQHYLYRSRSPIDSSAGPGGLVPHDTLEGSGESGAEAHVDTSVSLGKTYYYRLTATGEEREESGFSEEAVGIGYLAGDPSEDGRVNAADASLVLQDAVQKITFDKPQRRAGDVSGEGRANAGDASLILQHAVGLITQFPVEEESGAIAAATDAATDAATSAKTAEETSKSASMAPMDRVSGQLAWGQARPADQKEGTEVPVRLEGNAQNVRSVRLEGAFDPSTLEVLGAEPSAEGWQASSQISQGQGRFRVAMAGPESASSGQVAVLRVKVKEEAIEEAREPTLSADGVLNGAARRGLSAKTVRPVPSEIKLGRSVPNPSQGPVTIEYGLPEETRVQIEVYDVLGRKVTTLVEGSRPPGRHEVTLEGGRLPSGTYFYRMKAGGRQKTRRLTVVQ